MAQTTLIRYPFLCRVCSPFLSGSTSGRPGIITEGHSLSGSGHEANPRDVAVAERCSRLPDSAHWLEQPLGSAPRFGASLLRSEIPHSPAAAGRVRRRASSSYHWAGSQLCCVLKMKAKAKTVWRTAGSLALEPMQEGLRAEAGGEYICSQPQGKTDIPVKTTSLECAAIDVLPIKCERDWWND